MAIDYLQRANQNWTQTIGHKQGVILRRRKANKILQKDEFQANTQPGMMTEQCKSQTGLPDYIQDKVSSRTGQDCDNTFIHFLNGLTKILL